MINLHNLNPIKNALKKRKRIGRGQGSGKGGTASRGHKGAKSRSGNSKKIGFEGGQMPLQRRVPKFGFKNFNQKKYKEINLSFIQILIDKNKISKNLDKNFLIKNKIINKKDKVKILGNGELKSPIIISADKFTKNAINQINKIGGSIIEL